MSDRLKALLPFALFAAAVIGTQLGLHAAEADYCLTQLTMSLYYALVVMGLSLLMGFAGQVSLGHAAFFAIGGYTTAVLTTHDFARSAVASLAWLKTVGVMQAREKDLFGNHILSVAPGAAFVVAMGLTLVIAHLVGWPALRLKGHYLAMATLGFGLIINKLVLGSTLMGAADGITNVPEWSLGWGWRITGKSAARIQNYYLACGVVLGALVILRNLVRSRVGRALQAIHDREHAANAMGIPTAVYKLKVFTVSALLAALAGVLMTHYNGGIGPSEAGALKSVRYVALAALGGMANLWGVLVISTCVNFCSLRGWFGSLDNAVFGSLLILIMCLAPEGPLKPLRQWIKRWVGPRWFSRRSPPRSPSAPDSVTSVGPRPS